MSNPSVPPALGTHDGHGNSPAAWTGVAIIALASVIAGLAVVFSAWILFAIAGILGPIIGGLVWKLMGEAEKKDAQKHDAEQHDADQHDADRHDGDRHDADRHQHPAHSSER